MSDPKTDEAVREVLGEFRGMGGTGRMAREIATLRKRLAEAERDVERLNKLKQRWTGHARGVVMWPLDRARGGSDE